MFIRSSTATGTAPAKAAARSSRQRASGALRWIGRWLTGGYSGGRFATRADLWLFGLRVAYVAIGIVGLTLFIVGNWNRTAWGRDTAEVYLAAQRIQQGQPLYSPWNGHGPDILADRAYPVERMPYPPFLPAAFTWAVRFGFLGFTRLFYVLAALSLVVFGYSLSRLSFGRARPLDVLMWIGVVLTFPGSMRGLSLANPEPMLWALYGLALMVPTLRGFGFAAAASVKLFGAWPLMFAIGREGRRVIWSAGVAMLGLLTLGVAVLGWHGLLVSVLDWFRYALPGVTQGYFSPRNFSLSMLGLRVARRLGWSYVGGPLGALPHLWLVATGLAAPIVVGWWTRRQPRELQYSLVLVAAVLFSPVCWNYYLTILLIPGALLVRKSGAWLADLESGQPSSARSQA